MNAIIICNLKKNAKKTNKFFELIDNYIENQGMIKINSNPIIYRSIKQTPPNKIKNFVDVIKKTDGYRESVDNIYYTANLSKG